MKIAIATDAWAPQTNGVVITLRNTGDCLRRRGYTVKFVSPEGMRAFGLPTYNEIRVAWRPGKIVARQLDEFGPDYIHIVTEGPIGFAARRYCRRNGLAFTSSYHTRFPQYISARLPIPEAVSFYILRRFHNDGVCTMAGTESLRAELVAHGFTGTAIWSRGVDTDFFRPIERREFAGLPGPVMLYAGRVAVEKNLTAFLDLDLPGTKVVVGNGPAHARLSKEYPDVVFTGFRYGELLARTVASADVFVFPSRTDTFGLVLIEALSCGVPVAAYPVMGPIDVIEQGVTGVLDEDLGIAIRGALRLDRAVCREAALSRTWDAATEQFIANLHPAQRFAGAPIATA